MVLLERKSQYFSYEDLPCMVYHGIYVMLDTISRVGACTTRMVILFCHMQNFNSIDIFVMSVLFNARHVLDENHIVDYPIKM